MNVIENILIMFMTKFLEVVLGLVCFYPKAEAPGFSVARFSDVGLRPRFCVIIKHPDLFCPQASGMPVPLI